jgi:hypothetical protein
MAALGCSGALWSNEFGWLWRAKLRKWAASHGCPSMFEVAMLFGKKWAYHHRDANLATKLHWYPTSEHSAGDGHKFPAGSVNIRIGTWVNGEISYAEAIAEGAPAEMSNSRTGSAENPEKAPGSGSDLRRGEIEDGIITAENAGIGQKGYHLPKSHALMESAGASWAACALSLAPSLMDKLYPEFARLRKEREKPRRRGFGCEELPLSHCPF